MTHAILGGGLAGLSTAYYLTKQPYVRRVVVLEASKRLGGWIDTTRHKDGVVYEHGPRTVRPDGPQGANMLALVEDLGLSDRVRAVKYGEPSSVNRLVLVEGQLHRLPSSLLSVFRHLAPFERPLVSAVLRDLKAPLVRCKDTPLYEFIARRFGKDVADFAVDPLVRGICAGDARRISVHFIASYLHQLEQNSGSVTLGYAKDYVKSLFQPGARSAAENVELVKQARSEHWSVWGMENGLTTLVEELHNYLVSRGVEIYTQYAATSIHLSGGKAYMHGASSLCADHITMALPAGAAASLLSESSPELSRLLTTIPYVDVAVVNLEFTGDVLGQKAFGFLVPSSQPEPILGCIFDTSTFRQGNRTILTVMMGGAWANTTIAGKTPDEIEELALTTVSRILGITQKPIRTCTKILPQCIAQYTVGHRERVAAARAVIRQENLPVSLVGSSYDGVGINDTVMSARKSVIP